MKHFIWAWLGVALLVLIVIFFVVRSLRTEPELPPATFIIGEEAPPVEIDTTNVTFPDVGK